MHAKFYKIGHRLLEICVTLEHNRISYTDTFDFLRPKNKLCSHYKLHSDRQIDLRIFDIHCKQKRFKENVSYATKLTNQFSSKI